MCCSIKTEYYEHNFYMHVVCQSVNINICVLCSYNLLKIMKFVNKYKSSKRKSYTYSKIMISWQAITGNDI